MERDDRMAMSPNLGRGCLGGKVEFENLAKDCHILSPTSQFLLPFLMLLFFFFNLLNFILFLNFTKLY